MPRQPVRLAEYRPPEFLIESVDLVFELNEASTLVRARLAVRRNPAVSGTDGPLVLDGDGLELVGVRLDGELLGPNRFEATPDRLVVPDVLAAFELDVETRIHPDRNTELSGLYVSGGNFATQCEPEGFRRITYFLDRPDVMARYTTTLVADEARFPVLLSNGNPVDRGTSGGGRHWAKWDDPHPKPSYLFALVAGRLAAVRDRFTTRSGRLVDLAIWVRDGDQDRCLHAMESLKAAMRWDEERFGLEYDLDVFNIVAVSDFNMGAMENKGLNIFNTRYVLAKPETATDGDFQGVERVIAHEYFHNWTGNRVTCRDWFQLSLKEGLTVFRDQEFMSDQHSRPVKRISDVRVLRAAQFREDDGPLAHPVRPDTYLEINNFYTATVYEKGAEVIRMLHTLIGAEAFRCGMDLYFARHDNQAATIEDFVQAMQDASGRDLTRFQRWYAQAGTPELVVEERYLPDRQRYELTLSQSTRPTPGQDTKKPVPIPVAIALLGPDGAPLAVKLDGETTASPTTRVLCLDEARRTFGFDGVTVAPVPSLLRGFSAPVRLKGLEADQLKFLAGNDPDPFSRWDSGQEVATASLLAEVARFQAGQKLQSDPDLIRIVGRLLDEWEADPAFTAEALQLPSEASLGDAMAVIDVDAIHAVRRFLLRSIAEALEGSFAALYRQLGSASSRATDGEAMARRALRNVCLSYLSAAGDDEAARLARLQFDGAQVMTESLGALTVLADLDRPERLEALARFYDRWKHDDLVLDKWFAVQALSHRPSTLAEVEALTRHEAFVSANPNRIRALIGSFAQGNQLRFHAADGGGYRLLADQVIRLDPLNPQIAARLVQPLGQWRRHDPARQALMRAELERVMAVAGLSPNTFEMVSKSLAQ